METLGTSDNKAENNVANVGDESTVDWDSVIGEGEKSGISWDDLGEKDEDAGAVEGGNEESPIIEDAMESDHEELSKAEDNNEEAPQYDKTLYSSASEYLAAQRAAAAREKSAEDFPIIKTAQDLNRWMFREAFGEKSGAEQVPEEAENLGETKNLEEAEVSLEVSPEGEESVSEEVENMPGEAEALSESVEALPEERESAELIETVEGGEARDDASGETDKLAKESEQESDKDSAEIEISSVEWLGNIFKMLEVTRLPVEQLLEMNRGSRIGEKMAGVLAICERNMMEKTMARLGALQAERNLGKFELASAVYTKEMNEQYGYAMQALGALRLNLMGKPLPRDLLGGIMSNIQQVENNLGMVKGLIDHKPQMTVAAEKMASDEAEMRQIHDVK